jgi:hypothetical protein
MPYQRRSFFFWASLAMLFTVVLAFSPTYYFRIATRLPDTSGAPSLPFYLHLHGALLTAWYLLPVVQTTLIAKHRTDLHRKVGLAGVGIAVALIPVSVLTVIRSVPRFRALPLGPDALTVQRLVIGDLVNVTIFFPLMLGIALWNRANPAVHKRWMYLTYVLFFGPVLGRFVGVWQQPLMALVFSPLTWIAALIVYDVRTSRRVHQATMWGIGTLLLSLAVNSLIGSTDAARTFVNDLARAPA